MGRGNTILLGVLAVVALIWLASRDWSDGKTSAAAPRLFPEFNKEAADGIEGVETALSVMEATGLPAWAALSAGGIEGLVLPDLPIAAEVVIGETLARNMKTGVGDELTFLGSGRADSSAPRTCCSRATPGARATRDCCCSTIR